MSLLFSCLFAFLMYEIAAGASALAMTGKAAHVIASERSERGNPLHGTRTATAAFLCMRLPRRSAPRNDG